jgi:hypothetical protein
MSALTRRSITLKTGKGIRKKAREVNINSTKSYKTNNENRTEWFRNKILDSYSGNAGTNVGRDTLYHE